MRTGARNAISGEGRSPRRREVLHRPFRRYGRRCADGRRTPPNQVTHQATNDRQRPPIVTPRADGQALDDRQQLAGSYRRSGQGAHHRTFPATAVRRTLAVTPRGGCHRSTKRGRIPADLRRRVCIWRRRPPARKLLSFLPPPGRRVFPKKAARHRLNWGCQRGTSSFSTPRIRKHEPWPKSK